MENNSTSTTLTAEAIRQRLGFSTIAMAGDEQFGARQIATIRAAGITRMEVCGLHPPTHYDYRNRDQVAEIASECRKQGITLASVHGPALQYAWPHDEFRQAAANEAVAAARSAAEMGASVYVDHFSANEHGERTVREMLKQLEDTDITLAIENVPGYPEPHDCRRLVDRIDSEKFGIALDIGHPRDTDGISFFSKEGGAHNIVSLLAGRLVHLHLHDYVDHDHYPPFDGSIRWDETFQAFQDIGYTGEFMFEAITPISLEDTLKKTAAFPDEFIARYGNQHPTTG